MDRSVRLELGVRLVEVVDFLDHGGFNVIVATFWSHTDPARNVAGNTDENGLMDDDGQESSRTNGVFIQCPWSDVVRCPAPS